MPLFRLRFAFLIAFVAASVSLGTLLPGAWSGSHARSRIDGRSTVAAASATLVRGPYLQQPTDRSIMVVWATREPGVAEVRYGVSSGSLRTSIAGSSRRVTAAETGLGFDYYHHTATLVGLQAATSYAYRPLVAGVALGPGEASFRTAPSTGTGTISFIAFGDSGTGSLEQRQLGAVMSRDTFDFALHLGDIVYGNSGGTGDATYATYQSYLFDVYDWLSSRSFVPAEGNHDSRPSNGNGKAYLDLFELPRNGASSSLPDHAERYYSFDYGPVHFVALDTEFAFLDAVRQAEQLRWLATDLATTTQPWKVVFFHRAPFSAGGENGSSPDVRDAFTPLFEQYRVDLVLSSHEHDYERTVPLWQGATATDGVRYVVSGGGGAPLYPAGTASWTAFSASRHQYVKLRVDTCRLTLDAIGLDGIAFDSASITRCVPGNTSPVVALTSPLDGARFSAPATVTVSAMASDADGTIAKVDFYAGDVRIGTASSAPYALAWPNVAGGTYTLTAVATDDDGASATSSAVTITVDSPSLDGWTSADIGATGVAGSATGAAGSFSVTGAGADVWGTTDALHYVYRTLDGDGTIVARVTAIEHVHAWTKVGVMIRNSLSPAAAQAFMLVAASSTKGVPFQRRLSDGGASVSTSGSQSTAPRWVKLVRTGTRITGHESADGTTWTLVGSDTFAMGSRVLVGLGVSSHITGVNATATFDNVTVTAAPSATNQPPTVSLSSPAAGSRFTAPAAIPLVASAGDSDGTIASVAFYAGTTPIGAATTAPYSMTWSNVPAGTYSLTAVATDNRAATASSTAVSVTVDPATTPPALPTGWSHGDIGATGAAGNATGAAGSFTVTGAGADVWGTADALHYVYRTLDGDGTIVARVTTIENVHAWTKVGVMIRHSLSPSAAQAFMLVAASSAKGVPFQRRLSDGAASVSTTGSQSTAPRWVKLVRTGTRITGYESPDGLAWTTVGSDTFAMGSRVLIGLGVSSHIAGVNATATFDNVTVTAAASPSNVAPAVSLTSPTAGSRFAAPAQIPLVAVASDSDGTISNVAFYAGTTRIGTATTAPHSMTWPNVPTGTYSLTAVATDNGGATASTAAVSITVDLATTTPALPTGWNQGDIGATGAAGSATGAAGSFTVTGAGADVWGTADALHYVHRTLEGDGTIVARVTMIENVHAWTKVGVMIRNSLSPSAAQAFMLVAASSAKGVPFQRRSSDGGASVSTSGSQSTAPRWVKLVRTGTRITGYESADGTTWTMVGSDTFAMGSRVLIGLGVSSHITGVNATATFDNVTVTAGTASQ